VYEAIRFSAYLRQDEKISQEDKEAHIESILTMLQLQDIREKRIGEPGVGSGVSKHEAKRVTIGVELASNPSVLFLDEPTSGLDSQAAYIVMKAVDQVAKSGRTVICTIHQPSAEIFSFFNKLILLKRGGQLVFFGPADKARDYFINIHPTPHLLAADYNTADLVLDAVTLAQDQEDSTNELNDLDISSLEIGNGSRNRNLETLFKETDQWKTFISEIEEFAAHPSELIDVDKKHEKPSFITRSRK